MKELKLKIPENWSKIKWIETWPDIVVPEINGREYFEKTRLGAEYKFMDGFEPTNPCEDKTGYPYKN